MSFHNILLYCGLEAKASVLFKGHTIAGNKMENINGLIFQWRKVRVSS